MFDVMFPGFDESCANNPSLTSLKVRQMISKLVEDRLGESLDLTSDEAVSDLSSLSDDSGEQKSLEDQIAQAVIARVRSYGCEMIFIPSFFISCMKTTTTFM